MFLALIFEMRREFPKLKTKIYLYLKCQNKKAQTLRYSWTLCWKYGLFPWRFATLNRLYSYTGEIFAIIIMLPCEIKILNCQC